MEADLLKAVSEGKNVSVKIDVGYHEAGGTRQSSFTVIRTINGINMKPLKFEQ